MNNAHEKRIKAAILENKKRNIARVFGSLSYPEMIGMQDTIHEIIDAAEKNYYESLEG